MTDIDSAVVDSPKALDPEWPIREADIYLTEHSFEVSPVTLSLTTAPTSMQIH